MARSRPARSNSRCWRLHRASHRVQFSLAGHKQLVYTIIVIKSFAGRDAEIIFRRDVSRRFPRELHERALMRLLQIDAAISVEDLRLPPSNRLEALKHDRRGQWSIRINVRWRVCFSFEAGDAFGVEIVDYH